MRQKRTSSKALETIKRRLLVVSWRPRFYSIPEVLDSNLLKVYDSIHRMTKDIH